MEMDNAANGVLPRPAPSNKYAEDSEDDDAPLVFKRHALSSPQLQKPAAVHGAPHPPAAAAHGGHAAESVASIPGPSSAREESDSEDDVPLGTRQAALHESEHQASSPVAIQKKPVEPMKKVKVEAGKTEGKKPAPVKKRPAEAEKAPAQPLKKVKKEAPKKKAASSSDDEDDRPLSAVKASVKKEKGEGKKKVEVKKQEKRAAPEKKKAPKEGDAEAKWTTLEHNGVIFPPPYQPHGVKMLYEGKPVTLTPAQEEVNGPLPGVVGLGISCVIFVDWERTIIVSFATEAKNSQHNRLGWLWWTCMFCSLSLLMLVEPCCLAGCSVKFGSSLQNSLFQSLTFQ
jgi:DNA topoisomerase-1